MLQDVERWPEWWRGVERVSVLGDDRYRIAWRSRIPYELEFDFAVRADGAAARDGGRGHRRADGHAATGACSSRTA